MAVIPGFGLPGPLELSIIAVLLLPVVVLIVFLLAMRDKNK